MTADDLAPRIASDLRPINTALSRLQQRLPILSVASAIATTNDIARVEPATMTSVRRADFVAGRLAAAQALRTAGSAAYEVSSDTAGVPIFPDGYIGSISHSHGRGVAIAARDELIDCIGIDLEFDDVGDGELLDEVSTQEERGQAAVVHSMTAGLMSFGTLVLASKEALYKSVFPLARRAFHFQDAELSFSEERRSFLATRFPGDDGWWVQGEYEVVDRWIIAVAVCRCRDPRQRCRFPDP